VFLAFCSFLERLALLRTSSPNVEGVYQASKYLKYQVLVDREELEELLALDFVIYPLTGLNDGEKIEKTKFLDVYGSWIEELKEGRVPIDAELKTILAAAFTADETLLWKQEVPGKGFLVRIAGPVVQVQAHFFTYSDVDGVFRPMTMGPNNIFWGLQFSFPQVYQDPKTMELLEVEEGLNLELFGKIKKWVRDKTRATPFIVNGKRVNATIRLGNNCFAWINRHPQLREIKVHE
jgi:hypothetical protein